VTARRAVWRWAATHCDPTRGQKGTRNAFKAQKSDRFKTRCSCARSKNSRPSLQRMTAWRQPRVNGWHRHQSEWSATHYTRRAAQSRKRPDSLTWAARSIGQITPIELLAAIRRVEDRGVSDVAASCLAYIAWRVAICGCHSEGRARHNRRTSRKHSSHTSRKTTRQLPTPPSFGSCFWPVMHTGVGQ
jgi:hypothetical protein